MGGGCGGYGTGDSNNDGTPGGWGDFFADISDGGGKGRAGARFSSGDTSVLDNNNDNYVSEAEYMRGQKASEANDDRGGRFGDAYNQAQTGISTFSNAFGALPRGSIASEDALGPKYGSPIETKNAARFLQGGGVIGALGRGLTGGSIMSPKYVLPDEGKMTQDEYDRAIVKSFNSIGNTGEQPVPPEVAAAMGRLRGLSEGVATSSPVNNIAAVEPVAMPAVVADEDFPNEDLRDISLEPYYQVYELGDNRYSLYADGVPYEGSFSGDVLREQNIIN